MHLTKIALDYIDMAPGWSPWVCNLEYVSQSEVLTE